MKRCGICARRLHDDEFAPGQRQCLDCKRKETQPRTWQHYLATRLPCLRAAYLN